MTRDEIINKWIGIGLFDDEPIVTQVEADIIAGLRADIEQAITAAVDEERKTRPHVFVGSLDRYCEVCNEPDRDERHVFSREKEKRNEIHV